MIGSPFMFTYEINIICDRQKPHDQIRGCEGCITTEPTEDGSAERAIKVATKHGWQFTVENGLLKAYCPECRDVANEKFRGGVAASGVDKTKTGNGDSVP